MWLLVQRLLQDLAMHVYPLGGCPWAKGELDHGVYSISVLEVLSRSVGEFFASLSAFLCLV